MQAPLFKDVAVNGRPIPAADIAAEAQNHEAPKGKPGLAWRKAARALVIRELLLQEAARRGLSPDAREVAPGRVETDDEAMIRAVLEAEIAPRPPSEAALRMAYEANPERFRTPTLYEPAHILFAARPDDAPARAKARAQAEAALTVLARDPSRFGPLAAENSDCPSRDSGGRLGQISTGDTVPEFETAMDAMAPGSIAPEPVESRYGLHVLRLDARADGSVLPFDAVRERIAEAMERMAWAQAARAFTNRLVAEADITGVDLSAL